MNKANFIWIERASKSEFVASVWFCSASIATIRPVLADPCISLSFIKYDNNMEVVLRGPETKPREELLASGYECTTVRLLPGVLVQGFSAQKFLNRSLAFPFDSEGQFLFGKNRLQFPNYNNAELLIDQLYNLNYLRREVLKSSNSQSTKILSSRSYARLIKHNTGLSPYQLHQLERIHKALRLLKQGIPTSTVAAELNFVDQSHLTHATRQFLGYTPKQLLYVPQIP